MRLRSVFIGGIVATVIAVGSGSAQEPISLTPNTWRLVVPAYSGAPDGGKLTPMTWQVGGAYDPISQRTITFDRWTDPIRGNTIYANGIYAFDPVSRVVEVLKLSNWKRSPLDGGYRTEPLPANTGDPTPVDRHPLAGGIALDPVGHSVYMVNGANQSAKAYFAAGHPRDTWKLDLATRRWTKVADAAEGDLHPQIDVDKYSCMVYDPPSRTFVYFQTDYPRGTIPWIFNPQTGAWTKRPVSDPAIYTSVAGCAYDTKRNRVVVLGGGINMYHPAEDSTARQTLRAYSVSENKWTSLAAPPFIPYGSEFAYSTREDVFLALGGRNAPKRTAIYRAASDAWELLPGIFERGTNVQRQTVTYNVAHNVFVFAGGSWDQPVWALFRYQDDSTPPPPDLDSEPETELGLEREVQLASEPPASGSGIGGGCTTVWFIDEDCDGYGVAVRSSGSYGDIGLGDKPDADDRDPAINTPQTVLAKFDANKNGRLDAVELKAFLAAHKGITAANIYYISPTGDNATGAANDPAKPFRTYHHPITGSAVYGLRKFLKPGDVVIYQAGVYVEPRLGVSLPAMASGEPGKPIVMMADPGASVVFESGSAISTSGAHDVIVDGFVLDNPTAPGYGNGLSFSLTQRAIFRNIEAQRFNWVNAMQDLHDILVEGLVIHHNREHGLYMGSRELPASNVTVRHSILYRNGVTALYGGLQFNGRVTNLLVESNIIHSNGQWCVSFAQGVTQSRVQNNLCFNNQGHGIILQVYPGHGEEACAAGTGTICPYEQTNNVITNNTIWIGRYNLAGQIPSTPQDAAAILVGRNKDVGAVGDGKYSQGRNTVQNNIIVTDRGPMIRMLSAEWLDTWTVRNNVVFRRAGDNPVVWHGSTAHSLSQFEQSFPLAGGNVVADPKLKGADLAFYNTPERFNFELAEGSPAIGFGTATGAPLVDLRGSTRGTPPDAGAYAFRRGSSRPPSPPTNLRIVR